MKSITWRFITVLFTILFSLYLLVPSAIKFSTGKAIPKFPKDSDPWYYSYLPAETLQLGLDLMGGLHLVLGIDFEEVLKDSSTNLKNQLKEVTETAKIDGLKWEMTPNHEILVTFNNDETWTKVEKVISDSFSQSIDFKAQTNTTATLAISPFFEAEIRNRAIDQSLETLRNRIDEFGIAEPIIQRQGEEKILIQFPGVSDASRLKEIISRTAKLSFQIVRTSPDNPSGPPSEDELNALVSTFEKNTGTKLSPEKPVSQYLKTLNEFLLGKIPAGTEVLFNKETDVNTKETKYTPYLLSSEAMVTGEDLQDAYVGYNDKNEPIVNFQLTPLGATKFEKATGDNVGNYMAIVLDRNVHSAPVIRSKIGGGRAIIEMSSRYRNPQEVNDDAKDTALVLRSGALPARMEFLEERVIGPSLGADSIRAGTNSLLAGLGLILVFMGVYYRLSGIVASFALAFNGLLVFAAMAAFQGTLTLPGLAGLTLTLGMAVDANVLIFEHIREELRNGKSVNLAISEGYHRALSAIMDGNLTTIIAGLALLSFGYGPIRGFAVTLLIGLVASIFTAIFVTRLVFDYFVVSKEKQTLSI